MTKHWAEKPENGTYLGMRILLTLYRWGLRFLVIALLWPVTLYFFLRDGAARRASLQYLRQLHTHAPTQSPFTRVPGYWQVYRHFLTFAFAAVQKMDAWTGRITPKDARITSEISFEELAQSGRGGLLVTSHLGNSEVCRALVRSRFPVRISALVFTQHAEAFNQVLRSTDKNVSMDLIQVEGFNAELAIRLKERVDNGEFVVIVGDRVSATVPERSEMADFLGKPAPFAVGPWVLASILECPVHLMYCMRAKGGYDLMFEPFADQVRIPRKTRTRDLQHLVQQYAHSLEQMTQRYPLQWFNFYDFWHLPEARSQKDVQS
jgi:predicted LPLAT superfamily acyltransferase